MNGESKDGNREVPKEGKLSRPHEKNALKITNNIRNAHLNNSEIPCHSHWIDKDDKIGK